MSTNNNKVWYVTGCTSGVGFALTHLLLDKGYKVAGTSRSKERILDSPFHSNENFLGMQVNLVDNNNVRKSIESTLKKFKTIDVVVNNAGQSILGNVEEITDAERRQTMDVLYFGPANVISAVLPHFRTKKSGLIFNISAYFGGEVNVPLFSSYCSGKAALTSMTDSLREEVKPFGIRVCCVILGYLETNFNNPLSSNLISEYNLEDSFDKMVSEFTSHKKGSPVEFANFLIENSNSQNLPPKIYYGDNPYNPHHKQQNPHTNNPPINDKPVLPQQKVKTHPIEHEEKEQKERDENNPLKELEKDQKRLKDGNIHMPYILHE